MGDNTITSGQAIVAVIEFLIDQEQEIKRLQKENESLHHEISYWESIVDPEGNLPHRDGGYRDMLLSWKRDQGNIK